MAFITELSQCARNCCRGGTLVKSTTNACPWFCINNILLKLVRNSTITYYIPCHVEFNWCIGPNGRQCKKSILLMRSYYWSHNYKTSLCKLIEIHLVILSELM